VLMFGSLEVLKENSDYLYWPSLLADFHLHC
jgi:hypothetical protein